MIEISNLCKSFTLHNQGGAVIPVMAGAALSVAPGECVGLVGASGVGKSTLMRMIYGIPRAELAPLDAARDVIFNGSRQALPLAQARFPGLTVILVSAPAPVPVLAERLAARGRECRADIEARLSRADFSLPAGIHARHVVNDGPLDQGVARFLAALQGESV